MSQTDQAALDEMANQNALNAVQMYKIFGSKPNFLVTYTVAEIVKSFMYIEASTFFTNKEQQNSSIVQLTIQKVLELINETNPSNADDFANEVNGELFSLVKKEFDSAISEKLQSPTQPRSPGGRYSSQYSSQYSIMSQGGPPELNGDQTPKKRKEVEVSQSFFEKIKNMQHKLVQGLSLLSKADFKQLKEEFIYTQDARICDPGVCFTEFLLNNSNRILFDVLNASNLCYTWRRGPLKFGLSGELSIARLAELSLNVTFAICDSEEFKKIVTFFDKNNKNCKNFSFESLTNFKINFRDYYSSAEKTNRKTFENKNFKKLIDLMLNLMYEIKLAIFKLKTCKEDGDDRTIWLGFLKDSYALLTRLLITKSSLDSSQASALKSLAQFSEFTLFASYDFSAVVNTPYVPAMAMIKYEGRTNKHPFLLDDIAVHNYLALIKTHKLNEEQKQMMAVSGGKDDEEEQLSSLAQEIIGLFGYDSTLTTNPDTSHLSARFNYFMNTPCMNGKTVYENLISENPPVSKQSFTSSKSKYEKLSKLFFNYNCSRGAVDFQSITLNSRDIRAHDYEESTIRCFGIALYLKKRLLTFLKSSEDYPGFGDGFLNIEDPDTELKIINALQYLKTVNLLARKKSSVKIISYLIANESQKFKQWFRSPRDDIFKKHLDDAKKKYLKFSPILKNFMLEYPQFAQELYYLMCAESSSEFEKSQPEHLSKSRTCVHQITKGKVERVLLNKGLLFTNQSSGTSMNLIVSKAERYCDITLRDYSLDDPERSGSVLSVVDLALRNTGPNYSVDSIVLSSAITQADAAALIRGEYTGLIHDPRDGELWYNGVKCGTVLNSFVLGVTDADPNNYEYQSRFPYFIKLMSTNEKFKMAQSNARVKFDFILGPIFEKKILKIIGEIGKTNPILAREITAKLEEFKNELIRKFGEYKSKLKLNEYIYNNAKQLVASFFISLNTIGENLATSYPANSHNPTNADYIGEIFQTYSEVLFDLDASFLENEDYNPYRRSFELSYDDIMEISKHAGGGKSNLVGGLRELNSQYPELLSGSPELYKEESQMSSLPDPPPLENYQMIPTESMHQEDDFAPLCNLYGNYITVENSEFIFKQINSPEELNEIEQAYGYLGDDDYVNEQLIEELYFSEPEPMEQERQFQQEEAPLKEVNQFETPEFDANKPAYGFDALGPQPVPPPLGREGAGAGGNSTRRKRQGKNKHYRTKGRRNNKRKKTFRNKPAKRNNFTQKDMVM
jgi:hypothetical protein